MRLQLMVVWQYHDPWERPPFFAKINLSFYTCFLARGKNTLVVENFARTYFCAKPGLHEN